ncbi:hypothetical protein ANO14919_013240 [Xylariales sp. No.14919]|nr:hypothetical protein ANO14919_013240 [Xylariales sp. No.14919]
MDPTAADSSANLKERVKASYDAIASTYNEWTVPHSKERMAYLDKALGYLSLPAQPTFLELGCGCGLPVTKALLAHAGGKAKVIANDLSSTQLSLARANLLSGPDDEAARRLELVEGDMNALAFEAGSFDLVAAFYSIIHLPREEQEALLERVARWLKPGGYLVANFGVEEAESTIAEKWLDDRGWMFWSGWGQEKTLEKMKKAGLEVLVADVAKDVLDAQSFLWVVAKR